MTSVVDIEKKTEKTYDQLNSGVAFCKLKGFTLLQRGCEVAAARRQGTTVLFAPKTEKKECRSLTVKINEISTKFKIKK